MLIKELKEIINNMPDDADIIMHSTVIGGDSLVQPILKHRIITLTENNKLRLVLINNKQPKRNPYVRL